ncbi:MAG: cadmium-translocating P-type ATPase [Bacteroidetes bacterium]|nr:cadmium-translocating P-type ATPase [Bacteroidota bacterium]
MDTLIKELQVEGMTCTNCAMSVKKTLEKQGLKEVDVNFATGEVRFEWIEALKEETIINSIEDLGYKVKREDSTQTANGFLETLESKLIFSLFFTLPLMAHMVISWEPLHNPWVQLALSIPVYGMGLWYFGKNGYHSLKSGVPNMDVLVFTGAFSALVYSIAGTFLNAGTHEVHNYLFYETGASIITFVLLGNLLEKRSVKQTTHALEALKKLQPTKARLLIGKIASEVEISELRPGDKIRVNSGDMIPVDGEVEEGEGFADESMLSGESIPQSKQKGKLVVAGTILTEGQLTVRVNQVGKKTILNEIIEMVKSAQASKPNIQQLGDRVSAVFVPVVIGIALLTFLVSYFVFDLGSAPSMLRAVAVLVISCPCAMGLATPTALMVGIGRAAKMGILIKGGATIELFARSKNWIFDKTGTLSTGNFQFSKLAVLGQQEPDEIKNLLFQVEQHSSHPIARSLCAQFPDWNKNSITFESIREEKGDGMHFTWLGTNWRFGKSKSNHHFDLVLEQEHSLVAGINLQDELKAHANELSDYLNTAELNGFIFSGDKQEKVNRTSKELGFPGKAIGELLPADKMKLLQSEKEKGITAMIGDGINDAPALSTSDIGISFSKASDIARQSAGIVLVRQDLKVLMEAHQLSKLTYKTIQQNLFWAFFYNVICIPLAAMGYLHPMLGALSMAFSDVIVVGNSLWLSRKKLK